MAVVTITLVVGRVGAAFDFLTALTTFLGVATVSAVVDLEQSDVLLRITSV